MEVVRIASRAAIACIRLNPILYSCFTGSNSSSNGGVFLFPKGIGIYDWYKGHLFYPQRQWFTLEGSTAPCGERCFAFVLPGVGHHRLFFLTVYYFDPRFAIRLRESRRKLWKYGIIDYFTILASTFVGKDCATEVVFTEKGSLWTNAPQR